MRCALIIRRLRTITSRAIGAKQSQVALATVASVSGSCLSFAVLDANVRRFHQHFSRELLCCQSTAAIQCETPLTHDTESETDRKPSIKGESYGFTHTSAALPEILQPLFAFSCWAIVMSIWLAAAFGPLYLLYCAILQQWDAAVSFLCIWLLGGLIKFPEIPWVAHQIASALELWFSKFSIRYEHPVEPIPGRKQLNRTIYCYHPHGLFSIGAALLAVNLILRGEKIAFVTSSHMRWFNPLAKLMMDIAGIDIVGATAREVQAALRRGERSLILVPGGYEEAVFTQTGFERLFLNSRLGFVKYAMRYGYSLTPVYAYGENDLYRTVDLAPSFRDCLARFKIPIVVFYGHSGMPLMPKRNPLKIIVGEPVLVPNLSEPSIAALRDAHALYVDKLMEMYYRNNDQPKRPLEIV